MEHTYIVYALSFSLFCNSSEHITNKSHKSAADEYSDSFKITHRSPRQQKSLMDEYNDSFKPQLETGNKTQERKFGRGSSGPGEGQLVSISIDPREEIIRKINTLNFNVRELQESRRAIIGTNMEAKKPVEYGDSEVMLSEMIVKINQDIKRLEEELKKYNKAKL